MAIKLAKKFNGEIVCADSRQIYAEMTIGTAKLYEGRQGGQTSPDFLQKLSGGLPPLSDLIQAVPQHLFDIVRPNQTFNVAQYQKLAVKTIKDIQKRGKVPFLVGGTAFYINSVIEGWQFPKSKANLALRKKLEAQSPAQLFNILQKLDRQRAKNIDKNNKRRLIRAIEIAKQLGNVSPITKKPLFDCLVLGVNPSKQDLQKRIEKRTNKMLKQGLEKEVKALVKKYGWTPVLKNTIGYAEWQEDPSLIKTHTLQFAKRQMTWFKRDKKIRWVKNYQQAATLIKKFAKDSSPAGSE